MYFKNAFLELEFSVNKKYLIVEDELAKKIVEKVLHNEKLDNLIEVDYYPGGASNIKKYTILTYAKTKVHNRYILFDGDQQKETIPDFTHIAEINKTGAFLKSTFKNAIGISSDKMDWGVNANSKAGRYNEAQEKELILSYMEYYKEFVFFLPHQIPEDIIYDENRLKLIFGNENFPDVSKEKNNKMRLKKIADCMEQDINTLEDILIYWFAKNKNDDYNYILQILKKIIEEKINSCKL